MFQVPSLHGTIEDLCRLPPTSLHAATLISLALLNTY